MCTTVSTEKDHLLPSLVMIMIASMSHQYHAIVVNTDIVEPFLQQTYLFSRETDMTRSFNLLSERRKPLTGSLTHHFDSRLQMLYSNDDDNDGRLGDHDKLTVSCLDCFFTFRVCHVWRVFAKFFSRLCERLRRRLEFHVCSTLTVLWLALALEVSRLSPEWNWSYWSTVAAEVSP